MTRRDFLTFPLRLLRRAAEARSENSLPGTAAETRDKLVEYGLEGMSVLLVLWLAYQGTKHPAVIYQVAAESNLSDRADFGRILGVVEGMNSLVVPLRDDAFQLYKTWKSAYEKMVTKTRVVTRTVIDSDGKTRTVTEKETYEEPEWYEPSILTKAGVDRFRITRWFDFFANLERKTSLLRTKGPSTFNLDAGQASLYYPEKIVEGKEQRWWVFPLYAALGGLYSFYEEIEKKGLI